MAINTTNTDTTSDNELRGGKRPKKAESVIRFWINEIEAAKKREKEYRKEGSKVIDIYAGKRKEQTPYNILFSNTETLLPALYSAVPRPVVQRRFKDQDPIGKAAAMASTRMLEFLIDTNVEGYETFDQAMRNATLDALLPGRGVTCVKYDAEIGEIPGDAVETDEPVEVDESVEPEEPTPYKQAELVCADSREWNKVYFGYAKKWSHVPWVAFEEHIDKEEAERLFGSAVAGKLKYTEDDQRDETDDSERTDDEKDKGERKTTCIYQIWDKAGGKKVRYVSPMHKEGFLKVEDDPLGLTGFFNIPRPIMFIEKTADIVPVALYCLYENQAAELNRLTTRINRIVEAIKARGVYDTELGEDIGRIMESDDNALVPADKSSSLAAEKGLGNAIWFMPIEQLVNVLMQLYAAREQCKRVIYEVTGISDIIRGSTVASETATAQEIKSQWGTLRLKRLQKEVQRYARDTLRMMLEIAATKFSEETWAKMTGLPFVSAMQKEQAMMMAQAAQQMGQQPDPQTMAALQAPVWEEVLGVLRDDMQRAYRVDIETNSTIEPEATEDQKMIAEVMNAMSQYLNGVTPLVQSGALPFEAAQSMLMAVVRRFRFGPEIEDYVKQMKAPQQPDDGKGAEQAKIAAEMQERDKDRQFEMQKQMDENARLAAQEAAQAQREALAAQEARDAEANKIAAEHKMRMIEIDAEKMSEMAKLRSQRAIAEMQARIEQETALQQTSMQIAGQIQIATIKAKSDSSEQESGAVDAELRQQDNAATTQSIAMMAEALRVLAAPKVPERDRAGRIVRLVPEL